MEECAKIKALLGAMAVSAGFVVAATPALATVDTTPPTVTYDNGFHFTEGTLLSNSLATPTLQVYNEWKQYDASGICSESGYLYGYTPTYDYHSFGGIQTKFTINAIAGGPTKNR